MAKTKTKSKEFTWGVEGPIQILDAEGNIVNEDLEPDLGDDELKEIYGWMVRSRVFDERALSLQRQGRLGTYAPLSGQEACQVGSAWALEQRDWMFPSYREHAIQVVRGQRWVDVLTYWGGSEEGNRVPEDVNNFTISIPIATQILHAMGAAWAGKLRGEDMVSLAFFGDGGTSEGDFHEGLNFAGVFKTGTIFFCQNNQYAISVPRERQTASETIAQKAIGYGFEGVQVDGNDFFSVYHATKQAVEKGRRGDGPTLIEAITYRHSHHTTADDYTRYRSEEEVEAWKQKDPIIRFRKYLENNELWDEKDEERVWEDAKAEIAQAVEEYENLPERDIEEIFKYTFEEMPWNLKEQLEELRAYLKDRKPEE